MSAASSPHRASGSSGFLDSAGGIQENLFKTQLGLGEPDRAVLDRAGQTLQRYAAVLNNHLAGRDYLVGGGLTLADIAVGSYLIDARPARVPLADYANISRWLATLEALPAWQASLPSKPVRSDAR